MSPWEIKYATRCVKTLVFPDPAPAKTKRGPSVYVTARFCCSFKPATTLDVEPAFDAVILSLDMTDNFNTRRALVIYSRIKRKVLRHVWLVRASIVLVIVGFLILFGFGVNRLSESLGIGNFFNLASSFVFAPNSLVAQTDGRTNILIMGKAGGAHEGPDLTDTIIVASISFIKPEIVTISIPRDLWIPEIRAKINSAYYWGNQKNPGDAVPAGRQGINFAKSITREVVGIPIHYGVVIDFSAFKDIVDSLGGIWVNVDNGFTDKLYPIAGRENDICGGDTTFACRYETITFLSGEQLVNGETALKFVRSRHAEGTEGTDQAREARQQKVIEGIKSKIMDPKIFLSPKIDLALLNIVRKYIQTDMDGPAAAVIARNIIKNKGVVKQNLIPEDFLIKPPITKTYDKLYVLIPRNGNGNWKEINAWVFGLLR